MGNEAQHLHPAIAEQLKLTDEQRIEKIQSPRWIGYPVAQAALAELEHLLKYPSKHRMPNLLITGETNNGKTMILRQFFRKHPAEEMPNRDSVNAPVIIVQTPAVPDEKRLYAAILERVFAPYRPLDNITKLQLQAVKMLRYCNTKVLVLDEVHNMLASSMVKQKGFLNALKFLSNELQISIVLAGIRDAVRAIHTDPQMANRFRPFGIPAWKMSKEFLQLLASFERVIPLNKPSGLANHDIAAKLLSMCDGKIGELSEILELSAIHAITNGAEHIGEKTLVSINYIPPSERRKRAEVYGT